MGVRQHSCRIWNAAPSISLREARPHAYWPPASHTDSFPRSTNLRGVHLSRQLVITPEFINFSLRNKSYIQADQVYIWPSQTLHHSDSQHHTQHIPFFLSSNNARASFPRRLSVIAVQRIQRLHPARQRKKHPNNNSSRSLGSVPTFASHMGVVKTAKKRKNSMRTCVCLY